MRAFHTLSVIALVALTGGCHQYVPADPSAVPPGTGVRARLSESGVEEMRRYFGPNVFTVEGPLVSWGREGLAVLQQSTLRREGYLPTTVTDTLYIPPEYLMGVDARELNGPRTAGLSVAMLAGVVATVFAAKVFGGTQEGGGEGDGPPPDASVLLRFPIRIGFP